jgi:hypothetical protein
MKGLSLSPPNNSCNFHRIPSEFARDDLSPPSAAFSFDSKRFCASCGSTALDGEVSPFESIDKGEIFKDYGQETPRAERARLYDEHRI